MEPLDILKLVQDCNRETKEDLAQRFDDYNKSITLLFTTELSGVSDNIKKLEERVKQQNGSIRDLREWKPVAVKQLEDNNKGVERIDREHKEKKISNRNLTLFILGQAIFVAVFIFGLWYNNNKAHKKIMDDLKVTEQTIKTNK